MQRYQLLIRGKVQGVFFRKHTEQQGRALGLRGQVRNLTDGRVEVIAEGDDEQLEALYEWCWQGSPRAQVEHIDRVISEASGEFTQFSITG